MNSRILQSFVPSSWRSLLGIAVTIFILVIAACGNADDVEDVAAEPTSPEWVAAFAPEQVLRVQISDEDPVDSVAYRPDGEMIAAGTFLRAHLMNPINGETLGIIEFEHAVANLEFSPDGSLIAAGQGVYGVQINNIDDGSVTANLHGGYDNRVAFSPDGETIATANRTGVLWVWDVDTGDQLDEFVPPETDFALAIAYSPDGSVVALGNSAGDVFLFDTDNGQFIHTLKNPEAFGYASSLAFSPDGSNLAVAGARDDGGDVLRVWDVDGGSESGEVGFDSETRAVSYSGDGEHLAIGHRNGVTIVDPIELTVLFEIELAADADAIVWVTDIDYSPDGRFLLFSRWDGYVELWQVQE